MGSQRSIKSTVWLAIVMTIAFFMASGGEGRGGGSILGRGDGLAAAFSVHSQQHESSMAGDAPWDGAIAGPSFDVASPETVVVSVGSAAYLGCRVRQLGDRKVSWIRKRDLHILTFGQTTYTNDGRFSVIKSATGDLWTLRIRSVQMRDAGLYECQVSSEPKISKAVRLKVVVSQAFIHGSPEMYIRSGSDISLTCVAKDMPEPPSHFTWYKGLQILSSGTAIQPLPPGSSGTNTKIVAVKNKVSIETSPNGLENQLLIRNAAPATDAGNYTCVPAGAEPASIVVHVLNGEHPAAMQHGHGGISRTQPPVTLCFFALLVMGIHRYLNLLVAAAR